MNQARLNGRELEDEVRGAGASRVGARRSHRSAASDLSGEEKIEQGLTGKKALVIGGTYPSWKRLTPGPLW